MSKSKAFFITCLDDNSRDQFTTGKNYVAVFNLINYKFIDDTGTFVCRISFDKNGLGSYGDAKFQQISLDGAKSPFCLSCSTKLSKSEVDVGIETCQRCEKESHKWDNCTNGTKCVDIYNCCDCGGLDCGCYYCWSCNACDHCKSVE